jgi:hypothetical protein
MTLPKGGLTLSEFFTETVLKPLPGIAVEFTDGPTSTVGTHKITVDITMIGLTIRIEGTMGVRLTYDQYVDLNERLLIELISKTIQGALVNHVQIVPGSVIITALKPMT